MNSMALFDATVAAPSFDIITQRQTGIEQSQILPSPLLQPKTQFNLAASNVRTLKQIGQQSGLERSLEALEIDVCCLSETRLHDFSTVHPLSSPVYLYTRFHLRLSGDTEATTPEQASVGVALSSRAEAALLE